MLCCTADCRTPHPSTRTSRMASRLQTSRSLKRAASTRSRRWRMRRRGSWQPSRASVKPRWRSCRKRVSAAVVPAPVGVSESAPCHSKRQMCSSTAGMRSKLRPVQHRPSSTSSTIPAPCSLEGCPHGLHHRLHSGGAAGRDHPDHHWVQGAGHNPGRCVRFGALVGLQPAVGCTGWMGLHASQPVRACVHACMQALGLSKLVCSSSSCRWH